MKETVRRRPRAPARKISQRVLLLLACTAASSLFSARALAADLGMQRIDGFEIDRSEVSVGEFRRFVQAKGLVTSAEREGGLVYEAGWVRKPGWTWRTPYGEPAADDEPAVHVNFEEAAAYCKWAGKRLPTDTEWSKAAYIEHRENPPAGFSRGQRYEFPTGNSPQGANCLGDCGAVAPVRHRAQLMRGAGHARVGTTRPGVNGLYDMGANVWEWVDTPDGSERRTRGGSWWYGREQMRESYLASKPPQFGAVYIGFRCVRN